MSKKIKEYQIIDTLNFLIQELVSLKECSIEDACGFWKDIRENITTQRMITIFQKCDFLYNYYAYSGYTCLLWKCKYVKVKRFFKYKFHIDVNSRCSIIDIETNQILDFNSAKNLILESYYKSCDDCVTLEYDYTNIDYSLDELRLKIIDYYEISQIDLPTKDMTIIEKYKEKCDYEKYKGLIDNRSKLLDEIKRRQVTFFC